MLQWTPEQWVTFLIAFGTFATVIGKTIRDTISQAAQKKAIEDVKSDVADNTKITKDGASEIKHQLNGVLDERIQSVVKEHVDPLLQMMAEHNKVFAAHVAGDEQNMREIMRTLQDLKKP